MKTASVHLDPAARSADFLEFENQMRSRIIGQDEAVTECCESVHKYLSGFAPPGRPASNILMLGPTGSGKTRAVESIAEILFGDSRAMVKIDCAEFQSSHDISKLLGAPPGYVGHADKVAILTQEKLDKYHTEDLKLSLVLFDEIEKANESLWMLLLGILDKATMTTGQGTTIDFSKTMIFLTSNLGAMEMSKEIEGSFGFNSAPRATDKKLKKIALDRARKKFLPEFMNRLDRTIVFNTLKPEHLREVLRIELNQVQKRILCANNHQKFVISWSQEVEDCLLAEGTDTKYGARHLKRTVERRVVTPLSNLVMSGQVEIGDVVRLYLHKGSIEFDKIPAEIVATVDKEEWKRLQPAIFGLEQPDGTPSDGQCHSAS